MYSKTVVIWNCFTSIFVVEICQNIIKISRYEIGWDIASFKS